MRATRCLSRGDSMTFQRSILAAVAVALLGLGQLGFAGAARAAELPVCDPATVDSPLWCYTVDPHETDPQILDTPTPPGSRGNHLVFLAPEASRVERRPVFLPT